MEYLDLLTKHGTSRGRSPRSHRGWSGLLGPLSNLLSHTVPETQKQRGYDVKQIAHLTFETCWKRSVCRAACFMFLCVCSMRPHRRCFRHLYHVNKSKSSHIQLGLLMKMSSLGLWSPIRHRETLYSYIFFLFFQQCWNSDENYKCT